MYSKSENLQDRHFEEFIALCDGVINEIRPEAIAPYVTEEFRKTKLDEYVRNVTRPSQTPGFKEGLILAVKSNSTNSVRLFWFLTTVLGSRVLSPVLTGTTKLVREMNDAEKQKLLLSWRNSPFELKNRLFSLVVALTVSTFLKIMPDIHAEAMRYNKNDAREVLDEDYVRNDFEYTMMDPPVGDNVELYLPLFDAVIIGSGSGAGVVAHTLANANMKCLVIEKGKYYKNEEFNFDESSGFTELYENKGLLSTQNSQLIILAGSTFGGGSTVNWSACIKTPFKVRKEWYDNHGIDWAASEKYDADMDYVFRQMGASTDCITHSHSNKVILDGASKLGYSAKPLDQNTNNKSHSCGLCHLGCKWGVKQSSTNNWFRDAAINGSKFMDQISVQRIIRNSKNVAIGIECTNERNGNSFIIMGPKKFIVSCGALQTPVLLQKSGFRNLNIGKNLKLHPITTIFGAWDKDTNPELNSIMTAVCTEADDLDGKAHGAKIETVLHSPAIEAVFLPWDSSETMRQDMLKYQRLGAFLVLTRDTLSGRVTYDYKKKNTVIVDYEINKFDRHAMQQALLIASDIIYVEGAKEIIHPYWKVPRFTSDKPKELRSVEDKDYQEWRSRCAKVSLSSFGPKYGSAHQMSTCRMSGKGPSDGACDTKGRLFECDNVYVADASAMPTASGANPMITTMAIARHTALGIVKDMHPKSRL